VELGLDRDDQTMPRAGALELVEMRWVLVGSMLDLDDSWLEADDDRRRRLARGALRGRALHISLRYENTACMALLLPRMDGVAHARRSDSPNILNLPLALFRMPAPLREVVTDFLCTTFDCRVSPMRLGTKTLVTSLERWMAGEGPARKEAAMVAAMAKDVVVTLSFAIGPSLEKTHIDTEADESAVKPDEVGLRTLDIIVPAADVGRLHRTGKKLPPSRDHDTPGSTKRKRSWELDINKRRRLAGGGSLYEEGWEWRLQPSQEHPLMEALGLYMNEHLALNVFDPRIRVSRIACAGFVLSDARVKMFEPSAVGREDDVKDHQRVAVLDLLAILIGKADIIGDA
jgi:hypothetical protein